MKRDFHKRPHPPATIADAAKLADDDVFPTHDAAASPDRVAATQRCSHWSPVIPALPPKSKHH